MGPMGFALVGTDLSEGIKMSVVSLAAQDSGGLAYGLQIQNTENTPAVLHFGGCPLRAEIHWKKQMLWSNLQNNVVCPASITSVVLHKNEVLKQWVPQTIRVPKGMPRGAELRVIWKSQVSRGATTRVLKLVKVLLLP